MPVGSHVKRASGNRALCEATQQPEIGKGPVDRQTEITPYKSACGKVSRVRHMVPGGSRESLPKRKVRFADNRPEAILGAAEPMAKEAGSPPAIGFERCSFHLP